MKKMVFLGLLAVLPATTFGACFYQEIDPVCSITGQTYTSSCEGWSDTSSWKIPVAYEGACQETPDLTTSEKTNIYNLIDTFFTKKKLYGSLYENDVDLDIQGLNLTGQKFVDTLLFPAIKSYINKEIKKDEPNTKAIAMLNYLASLIGYDYYVSMPE